MLLVWRLEESELGAVLVAPLTQVFVDIDRGVAERDSIVLIVRDAVAFGQLSDCLHQGAWRLVVGHQGVTHGDPGSILNAHHEDVCVVEPEVALVDRDRDLEEVSDASRASLRLELLVNEADRVLDGVGALGA